MRVEILPALVRVPPDECMEYALICFDWHLAGFPSTDKTMWQWLFRWAGMPV